MASTLSHIVYRTIHNMT